MQSLQEYAEQESYREQSEVVLLNADDIDESIEVTLSDIKVRPQREERESGQIGMCTQEDFYQRTEEPRKPKRRSEEAAQAARKKRRRLTYM